MPESQSLYREVPQLRFFGIPGSSSSWWDPEIHGHELTQEQMGSGDFAEIGWRPGEYSFNFGASDSTYYFRVPESSSQLQPSVLVLRAINEFLKVAYDEVA
jgi:hypothetical protein